MRSRHILMQSSASLCRRSPHCGATPTVCFSTPVRTRSAVGHGAKMLRRSPAKTCAISRPSARGQRNRICLCRLPWCGTRRCSVAGAVWSSCTGKPRPSRVASFWVLLLRHCMVINVSTYTPRVSRASVSSATAHSALGGWTVRHVLQQPEIFIATPRWRRAIWYALRTWACRRARSHTSARWQAGSSVNATNDCSMYFWNTSLLTRLGGKIMPAMTNSERTALSPPDFCPNHCQ